MADARNSPGRARRRGKAFVLRKGTAPDLSKDETGAAVEGKLTPHRDIPRQHDHGQAIRGAQGARAAQDRINGQGEVQVIPLQGKSMTAPLGCVSDPSPPRTGTGPEPQSLSGQVRGSPRVKLRKVVGWALVGLGLLGWLTPVVPGTILILLGVGLAAPSTGLGRWLNGLTDTSDSPAGIKARRIRRVLGLIGLVATGAWLAILAATGHLDGVIGMVR